MIIGRLADGQSNTTPIPLHTRTASAGRLNVDARVTFSYPCSICQPGESSRWSVPLVLITPTGTSQRESTVSLRYHFVSPGLTGSQRLPAQSKE
jgi:hypothetical protein